MTIAYRRSMQESPAYINNHEELQKALQEGIYYAEGLEPTAVDLNTFGHAESLVCNKRLRNEQNEWVTTTETIRLPARAILVATGTQPNIAYDFEHRGTFHRLNLQYQHYEEVEGELRAAHGIEHCKEEGFGPFTSYQKEDYRVSLIGDTHPVFHGNVVKAIASGTRTYPKILASLSKRMKAGQETEYQQFAEEMRHQFSATVRNVTRKTDNIIELQVQAPLAAKHFKAGQFYRLQNFETYAARVDHTVFQMEPLALTGAECDINKGILTFIVLENTATAKLCATLKPNEPITLMGPTGVRAKMPTEHETVLLIGNQASFAFLRSFGAQIRAAGNRVLYLGYFNHREEAYCQAQLEAAADAIIWLTKEGQPITPTRPQDISLTGDDVIHTLIEHANKQSIIPLADVDKVFIMGGTDLLRQFQTARAQLVKEHLIKNPTVIGSVYGNMQCMLKGVCAQCLQWQIDPDTGKRTKAVFACSWQDQPLEIIDIDHLDERGMQNRLSEQINKWWVDYVFDQHEVERV